MNQMNSPFEVFDRASFNFRKYLILPLVVLLINYYNLLFSRRLLGDTGDARLSIAIYEHWFQFFQGKESLNSTAFFYPAKGTLGLTDGFFVPGAFHSFFRFLGFSIVNSWTITNDLILFIGLIGVSRLGSRFIKNEFALFCFVLITSIGYPFVTQLGHIQTLGYLAVFWFLDSIYLIQNGNKRQKQYSTAILFLGLPLLALSAWYPFALLLLLTSLSYVILVVSRSKKIYPGIQTDIVRFLALNRKFYTFGLRAWGLTLASIFLWVVWAWVYSPAFFALKNHPWSEINFYSPRLGDLINASYRSSGIEKVIYAKLHLSSAPTYERALGLTIGLTLISIFVLIAIVRKLKIIREKDRRLALCTLTLAILPLLILVQDEFGHSAWFPFWKIIPGAESIRAPYRISIYCSWILVGLFFYLIQDVNRVLLISITALMLIDTTRALPLDWKKDAFLPTNTTKIVSQLGANNCSAFYVRPLNNGDNTFFQIDNEIIATFSQVPTVNGYSGNFARGWNSGLNPASDVEIVKWLKLNHANKSDNVCIFDYSGHYLNSLNSAIK